MSDQQANLEWRDGAVPVSTRFDDPYFSLENGLAETTYVFLDGNDLPNRFGAGFHIAELGFGTGLNLLTTWAAWDAAGMTSPLRFTSFEGFPMSAEDMSRALESFPVLKPYAERLVEAWAKDTSLSTLEGIEARVVVGDARETLAQQAFTADAWFWTGFHPRRIPNFGMQTCYDRLGFIRPQTALRPLIPPPDLCVRICKMQALRLNALRALAVNVT